MILMAKKYAHFDDEEMRAAFATLEFKSEADSTSFRQLTRRKCLER